MKPRQGSLMFAGNRTIFTLAKTKYKNVLYLFYTVNYIKCTYLNIFTAIII